MAKALLETFTLKYLTGFGNSRAARNILEEESIMNAFAPKEVFGVTPAPKYTLNDSSLLLFTIKFIKSKFVMRWLQPFYS